MPIYPKQLDLTFESIDSFHKYKDAEAKRKSVNDKIAALKGTQQCCRTCSHFKQPTIFEQRCSLKKKAVKFYNICEYHCKKEEATK